MEESPAANQQPDLIVINHGTNDGGFLTQEFIVAMRGTLAHLYKKYPGVPVVYVIPLVQAHAAVIRCLMADYPNGHVIETEGWPVTFTDGIHPNGAGAKIMGERIAKEIRELGLL